MLPPIPKILLTDTVEVSIPADGEYGGQYEEPFTILRVRYENADGLKPKGWVLSDGTEGILYVDAVNSIGAFEIPVGSLLTINGEKRLAVKVNRYMGFGSIHHWEVEVK